MTDAPRAEPSPHRPRLKRLLIATASVIVAVATLSAPALHYLRAASVLTRIGDAHASGFLANYDTNSISTEDLTFPVAGNKVKCRLYRPAGIARPPAIVVLHGVHHLGIEEPRLMNFSRALASHGYLILTPELPGIDDYHVTGKGVEVIGISAQALKRVAHADRVGVLGLSFAGGLALNAAADPRFARDIAFVAAVGAQDDVARVLRFFATNEIPLPDGSVEKMAAHEYGPLVVVYSHPQEFFSAADAPVAERALRYLLWEDLAQAHAEAAKLSRDGQARMQLLFEHHTEKLAPVMLASIDKYRSEYEPASPRGHLASLHVPVFLLHGAADNVIPPAETLWLERDLPPGILRERLISPIISHVEMGGHPTVADQFKLVHWMSAMLDEADRETRR